MNRKNLLDHSVKHPDETVVVTGGNSGIGFEFIRLLLEEGYRVIFTVRNEQKGKDTVKKLKDEYKKAKVSYMLLDLSSFASIKKFVNTIKEKKIDIHHFYHNAGIFRIPFSKDKTGLEINTKTNYFGPYVLNELLIPYFLTLSHEVHINFTYSLTTYLYRLNYRKFNPEKQYSKMKTYARTKIMIVHYYYGLKEIYPHSNLRFTLSHPGATYTSLIEKGYKTGIVKKLARPFMRILFHSPKKASYTYLLSLKEKANPMHYIGPRGIFELSGYPRYKRLRESQYKNYIRTLQKTKELVGKYLK